MDDDNKPQGGNGEPQGGDPTAGKPDEAQGVDAGQSAETEKRLSVENAKRRLENQQLQKDIEELRTKLEETENAKLSEEEKLKRDRVKMEKQVAEWEAKAKNSQRELFSARAVASFKLPEVLSSLLAGETQDEVDEHAKTVGAALEKFYYEKFRQKAPDTGAGNRHDPDVKMTTEQTAEQSERSRRKW